MYTDNLTGATRTRKNTPRIREIEADIQTLVNELSELVTITDEEKEEQVGYYADLKAGELPDNLTTYQNLMDALDYRELNEEEERDGGTTKYEKVR